MISTSVFRQLALSLPEIVEEPHFEKTSFRVAKKIVATLNEKENRATIKLSLKDQDLFCVYDETVMYPVPNKWGKQGWTHINLKKIPKDMCKDALKTAYNEVAPMRLKLAL